MSHPSFQTGPLSKRAKWLHKKKIELWRILGMKNRRVSIPCVGILGIVVIALILLIQYLGMLFSAHPEVYMVMRSECINPIQNWNWKGVWNPCVDELAWAGQARAQYSISRGQHKGQC